MTCKRVLMVSNGYINKTDAPLATAPAMNKLVPAAVSGCGNSVSTRIRQIS